MKQNLIKVISLVLALVIWFAPSANLVAYAADALMSAEELENQETTTKNRNVKVDVYYTGGVHTGHLNVPAVETRVYAKVKVETGAYVENAEFDFTDCNFVVSDAGTNEGKLESAKENKVKLNRVLAGEEVIIELKVAFPDSNKINGATFSKESKVTFSGTYVDENEKRASVTHEITLHADWGATAMPRIGGEIDKVIKNDNKTTIGVNIETEVQDSTLPIKASKVTVDIPEINNIKPEKVIVYAKTLEATNGDKTGVGFNNNNYSYDEQTGKLEITVQNNEDANGEISWIKNAKDIYEVVLVYGEIANIESVETINIPMQVKQTYYNNVELENTANETVTGSLLNETGSLVDFEANIVENEISKGYIYNNKEALEENKKETPYTEEYEVSVSNAEEVDKITIKQNSENFLTENETEYSLTVGVENYAYNKKIKVSEAEFTRLLGENGSIIVKANGEQVATLTKTQTEIDISNLNTNIIELELSNPQSEGSLKIQVEKVIAKEVAYSKEQLESFKKIKLAAEVEVEKNNVEIENQTKEDTLNLIEPTAKVDILTNKDTLSTMVKNELVIKALLETDSQDDKLYKNPEIRITLPEYIQNLNIKEARILYADELIKVGEPEVINNDNGTKTIIARTEGTITKYADGSVTNGAVILLNIDITLDKLSPAGEKQIVLNVQDENGTNIESSHAIEYVAPTGLVATNAISNYRDNEEELIVVDGEAKIANVKINSPARTVTLNKVIINNYSNSISDVKILGRTFAEGNKNILTGEELGSNSSFSLTGPIILTGVDESLYTIYYSENGEATQDLENTTNAWQTEPANFADVKSYLIVFEESYVMNTGSNFEITYNVELPARLSFNQTSFETYALFFNNNTIEGTREDRLQGSTIGVTTGTGPIFENTITAKLNNGEDLANGADVEEGQAIYYTIKVKNTGTTDANSVVVTVPVPENAYYGVYQDATTGFDGTTETGLSEYGINITNEQVRTANIGTLNAGEEKEVTFILKVKSLQDMQNTQLNVGAIISAEDVEVPYVVTHINNIVQGYLFVQMVNLSDENQVGVTECTDANYWILVENVNNEEKNNIICTFKVPEQINYENAEVYFKIYDEDGIENYTHNEIYDQNTRILTITMGKLGSCAKAKISVQGTYKKLAEVESNKIEAVANVTCNELNGRSVSSQQVKNTLLGKDLIIVEQTSNRDSGILIDTDTIEYYLTLKNKGTTTSKVIVKCKLPDELKAITYNINAVLHIDYEYGIEENEVDTFIVVQPGEEAKLTIKAEAERVLLGETRNIQNIITVKTEDEREIPVNIVEHTIQGTLVNELEPGIEPNPEENVYAISGIAWLDGNGDGIKDTNEQRLSNIELVLIDLNTILVAKNAANGEEQKTVTNGNGAYIFTNVPKGNYVVVALYNNKEYMLTTYKKEDVLDNINSDFMESPVTLEGITYNAGITDLINLQEQNIYNIDLGLAYLSKFDLKLEKEISKITMQESSKLQEHVYNKDFAKIDLEAKKVDSTTLIIEYKIKVTNEGNVAGYAKKIADYIPKDIGFISELNSDWYMSDGNLYSISLANTLINPGESKELTLILTRKMSDETLGIIVNNAEIIESYNELGIEDLDSTPGNKVEKEDDQGIATIVASIKTGQVYIYTGLIVVVIAIITTGIYFIKKKVIE